MITIALDLRVGQFCAIHGDIIKYKPLLEIARNVGESRQSLRAHDDAHVIIACGKLMVVGKRYHTGEPRRIVGCSSLTSRRTYARSGYRVTSRDISATWFCR